MEVRRRLDCPPLSSAGTSALLNKFEVTFDSYWEQPAFIPYDSETDADRLDEALARNGGKLAYQPMGATGLEGQPYLHQDEMLEELENERFVLGHHRNLLVAATGTGKTVVAALDYKRLCEQAGRQLTLLFVAHRQEILQQFLHTYRNVMQSGTFGELFVADNKPVLWNQVFASVQSLAVKGLDDFAPDHFDAPTYRRLINHFQHQELLGLTATPERGDGINVAEDSSGTRSRSGHLAQRRRPAGVCGTAVAAFRRAIGAGSAAGHLQPRDQR